MNKQGIFIIGKTPPPIGGVTIHIERLLYNLRKDKVPFEAMSLSASNLKKFIPKYLSSRVVHLNISSVYLRALLTLVSFLTRKRHINTYHGSLGNKSSIKNFFDKISVHFSTIPLVLNDEAYKFASRHNRKTRKISAFIPPPFEEILSEEISLKIRALRAWYKTVFCTNAFGVMYDDKGGEVYGITELVEVFRQVLDKALVISDPSASYMNYFLKNNIKLTDNIIMITVPHSFFEVLKLSDCYIRNTSTDGDSLSVKEALYLYKNVLATSCVQRPEGVCLYGVRNSTELISKIKGMEKPDSAHNNPGQISGYPGLKKIYEELIRN
ncbi:MAG: glycosyltransferase family 1 protein [Acidobacteriota bacterium]